MFTLYTVAPLLYRMASSPFYNISLLTSDFYGLIFGTLSSSLRLLSG
jgi:solute carrier family 35 protein F1/2